MGNEHTETVKVVAEKLVNAKMWEQAYPYFEFYWGIFQKYYEDWLVGDQGILYQFPEEIWQHLVARVGEKRLSATAKEKIYKRFKANKNKKKEKEKADRKDHVLSESDLQRIDKELGYSSNSIFTDKRSTRAGNDPHGYFSSGF